jgi:hypothetical protein
LISNFRQSVDPEMLHQFCDVRRYDHLAASYLDSIEVDSRSSIVIFLMVRYDIKYI